MIARAGLQVVPEGGVDARLVEELAKGKHPGLADELVRMAREGTLAGVVTKPPRFSATTIQWALECLRKFYWPTLAGLEDPPSEEQGDGTELHKHQENYLKAGKEPPPTAMGDLARKSWHLLPKPMSPGLRVEEPFEIDVDVAEEGGEPEIVTLTGTIDLSIDPFVEDRQKAQAEGENVDNDFDAQGFKLFDHKTIKNARSFSYKTKQWLTDNPQANVYAWVRFWALEAMGYKNLRVVDKRWIYSLKAEKRAEELRVVDSRERIEKVFWEEIVPTLRAMSRMVRAAPAIGDVPRAPPATCEAYRGCPHLARCFGGKEKEMGTFSGKFSKGSIQDAAKKRPAPAPKAAPPAKAKGAGSAINPPPARPAPKKAPPPAPVEEQEPEIFEDDEGNLVYADGTPVPVDGEKQESGDEADQQEEEEEAPKRRACKTKAPSRLAPGGNSKHRYTLFIDCEPVSGFDGVVYYEALVGPAQADAAAQLGVSHYRDGKDSYGILEACFASWMEENAIEGLVVVDSRTIASRDVLGLLRAHASGVAVGRAT